MKLTLSWLQDYLKTDKSLQEICQKLTSIGLEVEDIVNPSKSLEQFTVAKIIETKPHPNSDKLKICQVKVSDHETLQIICGASNARPSISVIYAKIGSIIPLNQLKIKKSKIRDIESFGMLCSGLELGVGSDDKGILEVDDKFKIGTKLTDAFDLKEALIDLNVTPNRGDCLGVYGIARDLAAAKMGQLKSLEDKKINGKFESSIKVTIDKEVEDKNLCPYFSGYYIKNITNIESPSWLKSRLEAVGVNQINAVVDITNYVMFCLNQPLHAYDADKIDNSINIRISNNNEDFTSLKDVEYKLSGEELLICDNSKILALGGIIGGKSSTTESVTKNIFLEAAYFEPTNISKSGRNLNIISDARYRFERNVDISKVKIALNMATNLITEICGGEVSCIVELPNININININKTIINFNIHKIKKILNIEIKKNQILDILTDLQFQIKELDKDILEITVPTFRSDIKIEEDIVEELVRIYGYDKIPSSPLENNINNKVTNCSNIRNLRSNLCNQGLSEIITWSFINSKIASNFTKINSDLLISNPISEEMNYMRPNLLAGLMMSVKKNQLRGFADLSLFEIGKVFLGTNEKEQINNVSSIRVGRNKEKTPYKDDRNYDVMDIKKDLFTAISSLSINTNSLQVEQNSEELPNYWHPHRSSNVKIGKNIIGYFGQIHPFTTKKFGIKNEIYAFELFSDNLPANNKKKSGKKAFIKSDLQIVNRDFAFILDKKIKISNLIKLIKSTDRNLITKVKIFDIYQGENIDSNKKSIAFNVEITPKLKTLTSDEISNLSNKIIDQVSTKLGGIIRDSR